MPAICGNIQIIAVQPNAMVETGSAVLLSPATSETMYAGSGAFCTGDLPVSNIGVNRTVTFDADQADHNATAAGFRP